MLKSPRPLLAVLLTTTVVVTIVLYGLGWVLLHQQRDIELERPDGAR